MRAIATSGPDDNGLQCGMGFQPMSHRQDADSTTISSTTCQQVDRNGHNNQEDGSEPPNRFNAGWFYV
jgi:hypothetical protein